MHIHVHTHAHICVHVYVCMYMCAGMHTAHFNNVVELYLLFTLYCFSYIRVQIGLYSLLFLVSCFLFMEVIGLYSGFQAFSLFPGRVGNNHLVRIKGARVDDSGDMR